jgi:PAS domain S-box-containing protein
MHDPGAAAPAPRPTRWRGRVRAALRGAPGRDLAIVLGLVGGAAALSIALELGDRYMAWALAAEEATGLPLDELPIALSLAALGIAWYAWRRRRESQRQQAAHEAALADLRTAQDEARAARDALERTNRRLSDAIETIPEGLALFDAEDRYVLWNSRYLEIYPESADFVAAGRTFAEVLRLGAARGQYPAAVGRIEEWVEQRLVHHRQRHGSHEQQLSDGRWLRVEERRTAEGGSVGVRIDITDLKHREASSRLLFEANPLPMWVYDLETLRFLTVNDAAVAHYGYTRERFLAMTIAEIRPAEDLPRLHSFLAQPQVQWSHSAQPWRHRKADGTTIEVETIAHVITFQSRPAALVVAVDVTTRVAAEAALISARDEAEAASRAKSDFLANMSHELRTPLNAILGFSEMIAQQIRGPVGEVYRAYAADIHRSGLHLLGVVNDVLDLAKAEAGAMMVDLGEVDLALVVAEAVHMLARKADAGGVALSADVRATPRLRSDAQKLRQILLNLVSNAVKFTPSGGSVTVRLALQGSDAVLTIADTGIGMSEADVATALAPFGQIDSAYTRRHEGTGLGLPLAKRLAELLGGSLALASAPSEGTTATVRVPIGEAASEPPAIAGAA